MRTEEEASIWLRQEPREPERELDSEGFRELKKNFERRIKRLVRVLERELDGV